MGTYDHAAISGLEPPEGYDLRYVEDHGIPIPVFVSKEPIAVVEASGWTRWGMNRKINRRLRRAMRKVERR